MIQLQNITHYQWLLLQCHPVHFLQHDIFFEFFRDDDVTIDDMQRYLEKATLQYSIAFDRIHQYDFECVSIVKCLTDEHLILCGNSYYMKDYFPEAKFINVNHMIDQKQVEMYLKTYLGRPHKRISKRLAGRAIFCIEFIMQCLKDETFTIDNFEKHPVLVEKFHIPLMNTIGDVDKGLTVYQPDKADPFAIVEPIIQKILGV
jgi:hypothetical protein